MNIPWKIFGCLVAMSLSAQAQTTQQPVQPPPMAPGAPPMAGMRGPKSPEIGPDGTVTFRLRAPDATTVAVSGNFEPGSMMKPIAMTKDGSGVWQLTVNNLKPEYWTYNFVVNGVRMLDPGNVNVMRDGSRFTSVLVIPGDGSAFYEVSPTTPHGTVHQVWYPSPSLEMAARRMYVYTPAGYESGIQRYPVLYLLHGAGGDEDAWDNLGRAREIMDNLIAGSKAKPMIVVMTNGNWNQTAAPGITPQAENPIVPMAGAPDAAAAMARFRNTFKFSDSIVQDVIPFVDKNFRTVADRDHRAVAGLSMGGAQTIWAGLKHLDQFSYVASFSGAFVMFPGAMKRGLMQPGIAVTSPGAGQELDLSAVSDSFPALDASTNDKLHLLYFSCGDQDGLLKSNEQFMDWLTTKGVKYQKTIVPNYAHVWPIWRINLIDLAPRLFN